MKRWKKLGIFCNVLRMTKLEELSAVQRRLDDQKALMKLRDQLLLEARAEGFGWKEIARALNIGDPQIAMNLGQRAKRRLGK